MSNIQFKTEHESMTKEKERHDSVDFKRFSALLSSSGLRFIIIVSTP